MKTEKGIRNKIEEIKRKLVSTRNMPHTASLYATEIAVLEWVLQ